MIKNCSYFILYWTIIGFVMQIQARNTSSKDLERIVVETESGSFMHLRTTNLDENETIEKLPNLYPEISKEIYKFTNLTPHRALVKYESTNPFLQKGHELNSGRCLYIHSSYFNHLMIIWDSELLCGSEKGQLPFPCRATDYVLDLISPHQQSPVLLEHTSLRGYYKLSYINTVYDNEEPKDLVLLHKDISSTEECEIF